MRRIDYHTHTIFSPDAKSQPEEHILEAIKKGLDEICFTDHNDFVFEPKWLLKADAYFNALLPLKEKYKDQIKVKIGIEVGLDMKSKERTEILVRSYPFDFVIGSIHSIDLCDFAAEPSFYEGKTKQQVHAEYFDAMKTCVEAFDCFDVLGHLDYVRRYGPYEDLSIDYAYHQPVIDEVFKTLIRKGKGIEINVSGFKRFHEGLPNYLEAKRYYELGGRILTMGTDSHIACDVGTYIDQAIDIYGDIGFDDVTTFTQRKIDHHGV